MFHVEHQESCSTLLKAYLDGLGIHLSSEQLEKFNVYLDHLKVWSQSINLTAITRDEDIIIKHFVDSLAGLVPDPIAPGARLIDVGTGAGFPGIPLKIVRPDLRIVLVEPVQKKVSFLYSLVGRLRLPDIQIHHGTFQEFMRVFRADDLFSRVTTRALKSEVVLRAAKDVLGEDGKAILYLARPLSEAVTGWSTVKDYSYSLPGGHGRRVISILERAKP